MDTHQDLFWYVWEENMPQVAQSIIKCAIGKYRYRGDPQDVVQEVMLSAYEKWYAYDKKRGGFRTWVLELTKQYLALLYKKRRLKTISFDLEYELPSAHIGFLAEILPSNLPTPEEVILEEERQVQICMTVDNLFLAHRNTRKGQILEAMAALVDDGRKASTRNIAALVGCSHATVAAELKEIRKWLLENA